MAFVLTVSRHDCLSFCRGVPMSHDFRVRVTATRSWSMRDGYHLAGNDWARDVRRRRRKDPTGFTKIH